MNLFVKWKLWSTLKTSHCSIFKGQGKDVWTHWHYYWNEPLGFLSFWPNCASWARNVCGCFLRGCTAEPFLFQALRLIKCPRIQQSLACHGGLCVYSKHWAIVNAKWPTGDSECTFKRKNLRKVHTQVGNFTRNYSCSEFNLKVLPCRINEGHLKSIRHAHSPYEHSSVNLPLGDPLGVSLSQN